MTNKKYKVRVGRKADIAQGIVEITLFGVNQELLPAFAPGAHVDLYLPNGLVRAYSLTNASRAEGSESYVLAIGRAQSSRGGSSFIHDLLREGDSLEVGAPRNLFPLKVDSAPVLLIAGGIGITS
jgi:ferredoxin-NADP reductase